MKPITFETKEGYIQHLNPIWIESVVFSRERTGDKKYWRVAAHIHGRIEYYSNVFSTETEAKEFYDYVIGCIESIS